MQYRRALPGDFDQIVALQNANLAANVRDEEKPAGFLSTAFTLEQFKEMDAGYGIAVCADGAKVAGYICATTVEFNRALPLQSLMIRSLSAITYKDRPLTSHRVGITTPICIDKPYRATGVFLGLCSKIIELTRPHIDIAAALVSTANERSLKSCGKVMDVVGEFESGGRVFKVLIRDFEAKPWPKA